MSVRRSVVERGRSLPSVDSALQFATTVYIFSVQRRFMSAHFLSKSEAAFVAGLDASVVDRAIDRLRIGRPFVQRRRRARLLTAKGAFLIAADHLIARDIAAPARKELRKRLAALLREKPIEAVETIAVPSSALQMTIDFKPVSDGVAKRLSALEAALALIVEDDDVQAGAATFRGTLRPWIDAISDRREPLADARRSRAGTRIRSHGGTRPGPFECQGLDAAGKGPERRLDTGC